MSLGKSKKRKDSFCVEWIVYSGGWFKVQKVLGWFNKKIENFSCTNCGAIEAFRKMELFTINLTYEERAILKYKPLLILKKKRFWKWWIILN